MQDSTLGMHNTSGRLPVTITPDNDRQGKMLSHAIMWRGTNSQRVVSTHSDPSHLANSQDRAVDKMTIHKEALRAHYCSASQAAEFE